MAPKTGAAMYEAPAAVSCADIEVVVEGWTVVVSTMVLPVAEGLEAIWETTAVRAESSLTYAFVNKPDLDGGLMAYRNEYDA